MEVSGRVGARMRPAKGRALLAVKTVKIVLIMVVVSMYRLGDDGCFLGIGGTFNLNEEKSVDMEILMAGVLLGSLVYNLSLMVAHWVAGEEELLNDLLMNLIYIVLWSAVGGSALHYWLSYGKGTEVERPERVEKQRRVGLAVGSLCLLSTGVHMADILMAVFMEDE